MRKVRDRVNPVSTWATEWWCHSALRGLLTGHRMQRMPRQVPTDSTDGWTGFAPSPGPVAQAEDREPRPPDLVG